MFTINESFVNCIDCPIRGSGSAIADTNCPDNLKSVDIMFVAENPGRDEIRGCGCLGEVYPAGTPLIGKAGKIFRAMLNKYIKPLNINYFITNTVLCATLSKDGKKTENPTQEVIDKCKYNLLKFIEICEPRLIVVMGNTPKNIFGIEDKITKACGKIYEWVNGDEFLPIEIMACIHPSYVQRNGGMTSQQGIQFEQVFQEISQIFGSGEALKNRNAEEITDIDPTSYSYKISSKFYSKDYRLVDVQNISYKDQLVFIFRDKNNKKVFYTPETKSKNYYWYESKNNGKHIEPISDLKLMVGNFKDRSKHNNCYESDIKLTCKHALDYYCRTEEEPAAIKSNILFLDIEVYTGSYKGFPIPQKAKFPINAISYALDNGDIFTVLLKTEGIDNEIDAIVKSDMFPNLKLFSNEKEMLTYFINHVHKLEPDFFAGWNLISFDMQYIFSRLKHLKMNPNIMSPFKNVYIDGERYKCDITGYVALDMLWLYKNLTYTGEPSYKLDSIAQKVLKIGKKTYSGNLNTIYEDNIKTFIEYSIQDVNLLQKLDEKLGHIALQDELRKAATTTHAGASSTIGLVDGLFNYELRNSNFAMKNSFGSVVKKKIEGAYVKDPEGGIYDWVIDFDYTSLYPSIICSYNIGPNTYIAKISSDDAKNYIWRKEEGDFEKYIGEYIEVTTDPIYNPKTFKMTKEAFEKFISVNDATINPFGTIFIGHNKEKSIFYNIIKKLFNQRKIYKKKMFELKDSGDEINRKLFHNKQLSYKILMNSLYGVLAQEHFRFYNLDLASSITAAGRELIQYASEHVDAWMVDHNNLKINPDFETSVLQHKKYLKYCDTDSMFIWMKPYLESKNIEINVKNVMSESVKIKKHTELLLSAYCKLHNISLSESMFELKNELVCKRYYALNTKKKYALHVINNEGVDTDEIDIKGLETKRSDFSDLTKEMLTYIIETILKDEEVSQTKIDDYIDNVRKRAYNMIENGDTNLFKKVSFTKDIKQYKTIPQHIKAMLAWNMLEYDHFMTGTKGTLVPIKGLNLNDAPEYVRSNFTNKFLPQKSIKDLDVICIPEELDKIPLYYVIDSKRILKFAIDDRIDLLLEPIREDVTGLPLWDV